MGKRRKQRRTPLPSTQYIPMHRGNCTCIFVSVFVACPWVHSGKETAHSFGVQLKEKLHSLLLYFLTCMTMDHGTCRNTLNFTQLQAIKKRQWAPFLFHSRQLSNQVCILNKYNKYLDQFISTCSIVSLLIFM